MVGGSALNADYRAVHDGMEYYASNEHRWVVVILL